jgi:Ser-tRNA(Ala) deacylase AlaX
MTADHGAIDINEYEKSVASLKLVSKLLKAENEIKTGNSWLTNEETKKQLGL